LIKPVFREAIEEDLDLSGEQRLEIYRRYVAIAKGHWGADDPSCVAAARPTVSFSLSRYNLPSA
jgi:hypothetical protein